jgi:hypothetical protein
MDECNPLTTGGRAARLLKVGPRLAAIMLWFATTQDSL